jgi:CRP-like cAMP-binding protein
LKSIEVLQVTGTVHLEATMSLHLPDHGSTHRPKNRLLAALSDDEYQRLRPDLTSVKIEWKQVLYKMGAPVTEVYFPNGGVYSITTALGDGGMVECASVGSEGMIGAECLVRIGATAFGETMLQIPDTTAEVMTVAALRSAIANNTNLRDLLGRSLQAIIGQMMQSVSCNALHTVHERCCRWLLMAHDRMQADDFLLSQEFLGMMLGTRRQTVAVVAGGLQAAGFIRYHHGRMTIVNREGLEAGACECYEVLRQHRKELFAH